VGVDEFNLRINRPSSDPDGTDVWLARAAGEAIHVEAPCGGHVTLRGDPDPLVVLWRLLEVLPELNTVFVEQRLEIECNRGTEAVLPLWLKGVQDRGEGSHSDDDCIESIEDNMNWANHSHDHYVFINGDQWVALVDSSGIQEPKIIVVPMKGSWIHDWFDIEYASFSIYETANIISDREIAVCGLITPRVFAFVDRFDQRETHVAISPAQGEAADLSEFLNFSELAEQLRTTWSIPPGDDDFIYWGFLQLAKSGELAINLRGLYPSHGDYLGVGLSSSSMWSFSCNLPSESIREALGEISDRWSSAHSFQMIVPVDPLARLVSIDEQLQNALVGPEVELAAKGWVPRVDIGYIVFDAVRSAQGKLSKPDVTRNLIMNLERLTLGVTHARQVLGIDKNANLTKAWHAHESTSLQSPERYWETFDAYWTLAKAGRPSPGELAMLKADLKKSTAIERRVSELGWPSDWDPWLCGVWIELGGTTKAARCWADAGWNVIDVLTCPRLSRYWNPTITERLTAAFSLQLFALDAAPEGVAPWPEGDITIQMVLQAVKIVEGDIGGS